MGDKNQKMVRICEDVNLESLSCTPKQQDVLTVLQTVGAAADKELCYHAGVTDAVIKTLEKKGIVEYFYREVYRRPKEVERQTPPEDFVLSKGQREVFEGLLSLYQENAPYAAAAFRLLPDRQDPGIYLRLIRAALKDGKQVIMLVPGNFSDSTNAREISGLFWR